MKFYNLCDQRFETDKSPRNHVQGSIQDILFWGSRSLKKFWSHAAARKKFSGLLGRSGGMLPRKILKRQRLELVEIAFLDISSLY